MSTRRTKEKKPTLEELETRLTNAVERLSEAFKTGADGDISSITGEIRSIEEEMNANYYRRFGTP
jgi:hypothetical protein